MAENIVNRRLEETESGHLADGRRITLRRAGKADAPVMARLDARCFSDPWSEPSFAEDLKNPLAYYLAAQTEAGEIIGYAGIWLVLDEGHITNVAVSPDYRRCGIGKLLLSRLFTICEEEFAIGAFTLEVRVSNEPAQNLYRSFGFCEAGRRRGYYADNGEDALIMWRRVEELCQAKTL